MSRAKADKGDIAKKMVWQWYGNGMAWRGVAWRGVARLEGALGRDGKQVRNTFIIPRVLVVI